MKIPDEINPFLSNISSRVLHQVAVVRNKDQSPAEMIANLLSDKQCKPRKKVLDVKERLTKAFKTWIFCRELNQNGSLREELNPDIKLNWMYKQPSRKISQYNPPIKLQLMAAV